MCSVTCAVLRLGSANQRADMTRTPVINHTLPHSQFLSLWSCWSSPSRGRGLCGGNGGMFSQRTRSYVVERVDRMNFCRTKLMSSGQQSQKHCDPRQMFSSIITRSVALHLTLHLYSLSPAFSRHQVGPVI